MRRNEPYVKRKHLICQMANKVFFVDVTGIDLHLLKDWFLRLRNIYDTDPLFSQQEYIRTEGNDTIKSVSNTK